MIQIKLKQIIDELSLVLEGDNKLITTGINTLIDANKTEISFLQNKKYLQDLKVTKALAVFVQAEYAKYVPESCIAIVCDEPYVSLAKASKLFAPNIVDVIGNEAEIGSNTNIQEGVHLGKNVIIGCNNTIMAGTFIGDNVLIGDNNIIYPNVTIYRDCVLGQDNIIHAGTVIGSDGFGFAISKLGDYVKIYQNGNVVIANNVEIGSNTTIDRAAFLSTIIESHVRLDNLVHIAHNCILREGCILAGQTGLSGTTTLGEGVMMGGQSATTGHLEVAPFTTIAGRGVATKTVKESGNYAGFPLMEHRKWLKMKSKMLKLVN